MVLQSRHPLQPLAFPLIGGLIYASARGVYAQHWRARLLAPFPFTRCGPEEILQAVTNDRPFPSRVALSLKKGINIAQIPTHPSPCWTTGIPVCIS